MIFFSSLYLGSATGLDTSHKNFWNLFPILYLSLAVFLLEHMQPFYFTQDDNLVQFLPVILDFCRHLEEGTISTYNPYPTMGIPSLSNGIYSLAYPITHLSYFVAKHLLHNEFLTLEVFAIIHLYAGYLITKKLLRLLSIHRPLSVMGALCFVLSGYSLIAGRSWYYMLPQLFWTPALLYCFLHLWNKQNIQWILYSGLTIGISSLAGNVQMWIYNLFFLSIATLLFILTQKFTFHKLLCTGASLCLGLALAAPFLFLQYSITKNIPDSVWGNGIGQGILSMIFPYPIVESGHPNGWGNLHKELEGQFYYSGTLFSVVGLASIVVFVLSVLLFKKNKLKEFYSSNVWLLCGIVAFLLSLGVEGKLWTLLSHIPPFDKFSNPFKFLHFVNFFFILGGALIVQRFYNSFISRNTIVGYGIVFSVLGLLLYHITLAKTSFYTYGFKPFPAIDKKYDLFSHSGQRIFTVGNEKYLDAQFVSSLPFNIPVIYRIPAFHGYDNLSREYMATTRFDRKITEENLHAYGVKHILSYREPLSSSFQKSVTIVDSTNNNYLYELKETIPLAFSKNDLATPLNLIFTGNGFHLDVSKLEAPSDIVVNFAYYPEFIVSANGQGVKIVEDEKGRILVRLMEKAPSLKIIYIPDFTLGLLAASILLILAFSLIFIKSRLYKV
jgi:hypothetical protein